MPGASAPTSRTAAAPSSPVCSDTLVAHARITASKLLSKRTCQRPPSAMLRSTRRKVLRKLSLILNWSVISTMRGSVLHQRIGWPSENHGKIPCW